MREIDKLYRKYEYLADIYGRKVFNLASISYETEDIKQDFRMKLFSSIVTYVKQFGKFLNGDRVRPIPLEVYLKSSMSNFVVDFIKKIHTQKHSGWGTYLSAERDGFDYAVWDEVSLDSEVDKIANFKIKEFRDDLKVEINGYDLLHGLEGKTPKIAFMLFMKGFKFKTIDQLLKVKSSKIIKEHIKVLEPFREELLDMKREEYFSLDMVED